MISTRTPGSIMLVNGEYFDPRVPDPAVITLDVLATSLARTIRFNGHTTRPLPVDEHCLRVGRLMLHLFGPEYYLDALLHDAHEALTPWGDCLRPGKTVAMRKIEAGIDVAIYAALGASLPGKDARAAVKYCDTLALYHEAMRWQPGADDWAPGLLTDTSDTYAARDTAHLVDVGHVGHIHAWASAVASAVAVAAVAAKLKATS